jgi:tetratricopeptide (TPR) repeat protein
MFQYAPITRQMAQSPSDLLFLAHVQIDMERPENAMPYFKQFAFAHPCLDVVQRNLFICIYKAAFDPLRKAIHVLAGELLTESATKRTAICDRLRAAIDRYHSELKTVAEETIGLIETVLLPNSDGPRAQSFYHRFIGDIWRYRAENAREAEKAEFNEKASQAYERAIEIAATLPAADAARLGTILNYGVFLRENLDQLSEAIELVTDAVKKGRAVVVELAGDDRDEAEEVLEIMESNLLSWDQDESDDEKEEEDAHDK